MAELMKWPVVFGAAAMLLAAPLAHAQSTMCEDEFKLNTSIMDCYRLGTEPDPLKLRILQYETLAVQSRPAVQPIRASPVWLLLHADRTSVAFGHALREEQPVAGAAAARFVQLHAEVEDLAGVARIDADAVVAHHQPVAGLVAGAIDGDHPLALRPVIERERVRDQRADRLAHLLFIDVDGREVGRDLHPHTPFFDQVVVLEQRFLDDLAQRLRA